MPPPTVAAAGALRSRALHSTRHSENAELDSNGTSATAGVAVATAASAVSDGRHSQLQPARAPPAGAPGGAGQVHQRLLSFKSSLTSSREVRADVLRQTLELWALAAANPRRLLSGVVVLAVLGLLRRVGGLQHMHNVLEEALRLEEQITNDAAAEAAAAPSSSTTSGATSRPAFCLVSTACFLSVLSKIASFDAPQYHLGMARMAWEQALQRHERFYGDGNGGDSGGGEDSAEALEACRAAYASILGRMKETEAQQRLVRLNNEIIALTHWAQEDEANPSAHADAERLVETFLSEGGRLDLPRFLLWMNTYERDGRWREAEAAWARLDALQLRPDAAAYCALMCVLMADGQPAQLFKVDLLYAEMCAGVGPGTALTAARPLRMRPRDFGELIRCARRCLLPDQVERWGERARQADGVWTNLDRSTRTLVARAADWAPSLPAPMRPLQHVQERLLAAGFHAQRQHDAAHSLAQKEQWQSLRDDAARALTSLLHAVSSGAYWLTWADWKRVLHTLKSLRLFSLALPFYAALRERHAPFVAQWEAQRASIEARYAREQRGAPPPQSTTPPPQLRMPAICVAMLLDCVIQAAETHQQLQMELGRDAASAAHEPESSSPSSLPTSLRLARLPPSDLSGVEQARWMLEEMRSEAAREYVEGEGLNAAPWNAVLRALTAAVTTAAKQPSGPHPSSGPDAATAAALQRAQTFFESILRPDAFSRQLMLGAQAAAAGQKRDFIAEAESLEQQHLEQPAAADELEGLSAMATTLRIGALADQLRSSLSVRGLLPSSSAARGPQGRGGGFQLTGAEQELISQAQSLWAQALRHPRQGLSTMAAANMMRVLHLARDVRRQLALISTALATEEIVAEEEEEERLGHNRDDSGGGGSGGGDGIAGRFTNVGAPVFVDSSVYSILFNSLALSSDPASYTPLATGAWERLWRRHASALALRQFKRARQLQVGDVVVSAYFKFLQRAGQANSLLHEWRELPAVLKQGNPALCASLLSALAARGDWSTAESVVVDMERLGVAMDVRVLNAWLGCYERDGCVEQARRAWEHVRRQTRVEPDAASYRIMMQVHMARREDWASGGEGSPGAAQVEALYAEMQMQTQEGSGPGAAVAAPRAPIQMAPRDFAKLIHAAYAYGLHDEVLKWAQRARDAGVEPPQLPQSIIERAALLVRSHIDPAAVPSAVMQTEPDAEPNDEDEHVQADAARSTVEASDAQSSLSSQAPIAYLTRLQSRLTRAHWPATEWVVGEAEAEDSESLLDIQTANTRMGGYERAGGWRGAETMWRLMDERAITPNPLSYRTLMQVYMASGEAEQLAKIEPLYDQFRSGSGPNGRPLHFSVHDFERLIRAAHRCRLPAEARKWAERAKAAGVWDAMELDTQRSVEAKSREESHNGKAKAPRVASLRGLRIEEAQD